MTPDKALRWWGVILTGVGVVLALGAVWWLATSTYPSVALIDAVVLYGAGGMLAVCGVILLIIDGLLRLTSPRGREPGRTAFWSTRRVVLVITVLSGGLAIAAGIFSVIVVEADPANPVSQLGWFSVPAGLVFAGGLFFVVGDAVLEATAPLPQQEVSGRVRTSSYPVGVVGWALRAYAICVAVGAVGGIALAMSVEDSQWIGWSVFLFVCAAAFAWGVWPVRGVSVSRGPGTGVRSELARTAARWRPDPSPRQVSLVILGGSVGIAVPSFLLTVFVIEVWDWWMPLGLLIFFGPPRVLCMLGLLVFLGDGLNRLTHPRKDHSDGTGTPAG